MIRGVGILGLGLWQGRVVENDAFSADYLQRAEVKDPYHGRRGDDGTVRIAGMEFVPGRHDRTLAAIERSFADPFRGTRRRRWLGREEKVSDAETEAAARAMEKAGIGPRDVGALLVQSFLPDQLNPKNSALVAHNLGITAAPVWEVDSVCNSSLSQLMVGALLIAQGHAKHVVCVQSVAYSRVRDPGASASVQEGDMASAFVLGRVPGAEMAFSWRVDGSLHPAISLQWSAPTGAPPRRYWERSDERLLIRFDHELQQRVNREVADHARVTSTEALAKAEMRLEEVELFATHQPMSWYGAFMDDVLGLADGVSASSFEEYANVNSASLPASLHEAEKAGRLGRGASVLLFCPAAGYTYGAVAMRW